MSKYITNGQVSLDVGITLQSCTALQCMYTKLERQHYFGPKLHEGNRKQKVCGLFCLLIVILHEIPGQTCSGPPLLLSMLNSATEYTVMRS